MSKLPSSFSLYMITHNTWISHSTRDLSNPLSILSEDMQVVRWNNLLNPPPHLQFLPHVWFKFHTCQVVKWSPTEILTKKKSTKELSGNKTTHPRHLKIAPASIIIVHHHHISMKSENLPKHCHNHNECSHNLMRVAHIVSTWVAVTGCHD